MRPAEVARRAAGYLERHDVDSPLASAEVLLADVLGTDRTGLYVRTEGLSAQEAKWFGRALCRRCTGTPLQHLTGRQAFRRLTLDVRPGVFVPRPETEVLVEAALTLIEDRASPLVVDVGTGSGAVALAIAQEHPGAQVVATDRSAEALALAAYNAARLDLPVELYRGDLLEALPAGLESAIDLVVSNPPYVDPATAGDLPADVRADPSAALFAAPDLTARLLSQAAHRLRPGGAVAIEIEESNADRVDAVAREAGLVDVRVLPDLNGRDRVVTARRP